MKMVKRLLTTFRKEETGTATTVEAALWLPVFVMFLALVIDVSSIYNQQSTMLRIVQDVNRAYAVGRFTSEEEVEAFLKNAISGYTVNGTVDTTYDGGVITTTLNIPATDLMPVNKFPAFSSTNIVVTSQQLAEF